MKYYISEKKQNKEHRYIMIHDSKIPTYYHFIFAFHHNIKVDFHDYITFYNIMRVYKNKEELIIDHPILLLEG